MKAKAILVVTHGEITRGENPRLTFLGVDQARALKALLPAKPPMVICGTGRRHYETWEELKLPMTATRWTPLVGGLESREGDRVVLMPSLTLGAKSISVPLAQYGVDGAGAEAAALLAIINTVPDGTVIIAGQPAMIALGMAEVDAQQGALYRVSWEDDPEVPLKCVKSLDIQQVVQDPATKKAPHNHEERMVW